MYRMGRRGFLKLAGITLLGLAPFDECYAKGSEREKDVIYTFDDIPFEMERTEKLSRILKENGCLGQFYFTGDAIRVFPDSVDYLLRNGYDVGWHSMHHDIMSKKTDKEFLYDVREWKKVIRDVSQYYKPRHARFPYGRGTKNQIRLLEGEDLYIQPCAIRGISTYNWDIDSRDWSWVQCLPYKSIAKMMEKMNLYGMVLLFHLRLGNPLSCMEAGNGKDKLKESFLLRDLDGFQDFLKKTSHHETKRLTKYCSQKS